MRGVVVADDTGDVPVALVVEALSRPRISSFFSACFGVPKMVSASSTRSVGGSSVIDRKTAAGLVLMVSIGSWTVSVSTSSSRDLPHRFVGPTTARRGACCHAGCRCVAAAHSVTASSASGEGRITNLAICARSSSSNAEPGVGSGSGAASSAG